VHQQHTEDEHRPPHAGAVQPADVHVVALEQAPGGEQEDKTHDQARGDRAGLPLVEGR
jgi:hypothetical protein